MITRREVVMGLGAVALFAPFGAFAQQPGKVWRIGYLAGGAGPDAGVDVFREQLRALGYVEGRNIAFEYRWTAGREERAQELAEELVRLKVDVIVTRTTFITAAVKRATGAIPIVMSSAADPVGAGVIASLARPGGNVTGVTQNSTETDGKRLQLLHETVPRATRVATLVWDKSIITGFQAQVRATAKQLGITLFNHAVGTPEAITGAFAAMQRERVQALMVQTGPFMTNHIKMIVDLAARHRLPAMYQVSNWVDGGGLMYYGSNGKEQQRHAALYVDRILKGARPADLPVEEPTKYDLVINLATAKALGLTIPQAVLLRAEVIR